MNWSSMPDEIRYNGDTGDYDAISAGRVIATGRTYTEAEDAARMALATRKSEKRRARRQRQSPFPRIVEENDQYSIQMLAPDDYLVAVRGIVVGFRPRYADAIALALEHLQR